MISMPEKTKRFKAGSKTSPDVADVLIAGGGVAGLTLAVLLAGQGLSIHLVEPRPPAPLKDTSASSRTVALMESSLNVLRAAGAEDLIDRYGTSLKAMRIIDDSMPMRADIDAVFEASEIGRARFGANIPNDLIRAFLFERLLSLPSAQVHAPAAIAQYTAAPHDAEAVLDNGLRLRARVIIAADGKNSTLRSLAGIACDEKIYDQSAITCLIGHSRAHDHTATEFHRPAGPLAFVPMEGKASSVVWIERHERAEALMKLRRDEFIAALQEASQDILGTLTLNSNPHIWPLRSLEARRLTAPRLALMAEAAHAMSPITAQGLNLSLRDVATLAEVLVDAARGGMDIGQDSVLRHYSQRRGLDISTRVMGVDRMNSLVSTDMLLLKRVRRGGLKAVAGIAPLKKFAAHQGLAPDMDAGRLMRGQAL